MPQAKVREGKRYRYWRPVGVELTSDRYGNEKRREIGSWVFAEGGEIIEVTPNALKGARDFLEPVGVVEPIGKQDQPYSDTDAVLDGLWQAVCKSVERIDDPELLSALREAETEGRARGSVLDAIDAALDDCGEVDDEEDENDDE